MMRTGLTRIARAHVATGAVLALLICASSAPAAPTHHTAMPGTWGTPTTAPGVIEGHPLSVWTGRQMIVFGRHHLPATTQFPVVGRNVNVAFAYTPGTGHWRTLTPPLGPSGAFQGDFSTVWTGTEMLVWGPFTDLAYNPSTNVWRQLPPSPLEGRGPPASTVWTGTEMIGWGGGCCGDAFNTGAAYNPATNTWRKLAASTLAPAQNAVGAWDGHEMLLFIGPRDVNGKSLPASQRAAAYDPAADTWRPIAPMPAARENAVWDGHELLLVGGTAAVPPGSTKLATSAFAYDPGANHWRQIAAMPSGRTGAAAVWTGAHLLLWGGQTTPVGETVTPSHGLAYDPAANRWSALPPAKLLGRNDPAAVWTGRLMLVWGGQDTAFHPLGDGARFRPRTP